MPVCSTGILLRYSGRLSLFDQNHSMVESIEYPTAFIFTLSLRAKAEIS